MSQSDLPIDVIDHWITGKSGSKSPVLLGLSAPQGAGKTTITTELQHRYGDRLLVLCLDDFYLTKAERASLAKEVSPLFETRGPPGTHDLALLNTVLDDLHNASENSTLRIPQFDKVTDERKPENQWIEYKGQPDVILLEGWCVGALCAADFVRDAPLNDVEETDTDNRWRTYSAEQLAGDYKHLWQRCDDIFYMLTKDFGQVSGWRIQQEETNLGLKHGALPSDQVAWVGRFVQHFQRVTQDIEKGHRIQGCGLYLDKNRQILSRLL